jgi:hypothetical protein
MGKIDAALGGLALLAIPIVGAQAQTSAVATWVSNTGVDTGSCALATPCRTFQYAHDHTSAGGEIDVLNPGKYGQLTISKAISIVAVGVQAGLSVPQSGNGITVNAGVGDNVVIRGLTLDGHGTGMNGIVVAQVAHLVVRDCVLQGMTNAGLYVTNATTNAMYLSVVNIVAQNNTYGIYKQSGYKDTVNHVTSAAFLTILNSHFMRNGTGIYSHGDQTGIELSTIEFNKTYGIASMGSVFLHDSIVRFNATDQFASGTIQGFSHPISNGDNVISDPGTFDFTTVDKR